MYNHYFLKSGSLSSQAVLGLFSDHSLVCQRQVPVSFSAAGNACCGSNSELPTKSGHSGQEEAYESKEKIAWISRQLWWRDECPVMCCGKAKAIVGRYVCGNTNTRTLATAE